jgi:hypothetical protein
MLLPKDSWIKKMTKSVFLNGEFEKISYFMATDSLNRQFYEFYSVESEQIIMMPYAVDNQFFKDNCKIVNFSLSNLKV